MKEFSGKTVFPGVAFGKVRLLLKQELSVDTSPAKDPDTEKKAFREAIKQADNELEALFEKTRAEVGEDEANIIDVQRMMLQDDDFIGMVDAFINGDLNQAAYAVDRAGKQLYNMFFSLEDPYMKARAPDIADISRRLTAILLSVRSSFTLTEPSIVAADDLTPSDTLSLDKKLILGFITRKGATNSHTAILARILKIPSIVQANITNDELTAENFEGKDAAIDGHTGTFYLEPDAAATTRLTARREKDLAEAALLETLRGKETITKDGRRIELAANIGGIEDIEAVLANDAEGIGLFRSEFLYLGKNTYPGEEEQFKAYKTVAEALKGKRVVIRTLDIGADKQAAYFGLDEEENPALGLRAIRLCFQRPEMFKTQLRAIYRASAYGKIAVMFPMIASVWELKKCKEFAAQAREELIKEGVATGDVELGIMVETPAAAVCAEDLAEEADFFSVGTNDLTQYTLAVDRQNAGLELFADTHHPALLKLLAHIAESAHKAGIWAGICGELGADPDMTRKFLEMGYDELSMSPGFILGMRKRIREMDLSQK
jgi:phosphotransferase system enzyme I (PtsI)